MDESVSYETKSKLVGKSATVVVCDEAGDWKDRQNIAEYAKLNQAFDWFNDRLFDKKLPEVFFTISRHRGALGYFAPNALNARKFDENGEKLPPEYTVHEISLMPDGMYSRPDRDVLSTLVHEMAHLWQAENGKPSRGGYHNGEWAAKMEEIGLMPSSLGAYDSRNPYAPKEVKERGLEGAKTGPKMSHYIIPDGRFDTVCKQLLDTGFSFGLDAAPTLRKQAPKSKFKFTCPTCNANAWAKSGSRLGCWNTTECNGGRMKQEETED